MNIDEILSFIREGREILIPDTWAQGRTIFGGLTAAILCEATAKETESNRKLTNFSINFIRPFETLKPFEIKVETQVNGKRVTIKSASIIQEGKIRAAARADYVLPLESRVIIDTFTPPQLKEKNSCIYAQDDDWPPFFRNFDNHIATKGFPFRGPSIPEMGGWMGFKEPLNKITNSHLICMIDSWAPTASIYYRGAKPVSTLSWNIHFSNTGHVFLPNDHLGYLSKINFGENGLSSSQADIWEPGGKLLAKSFQTNIIYG